MPYDDNENLPFGVTPLDANTAGVSRWDDRQTAFSKMQTHELGKQLESSQSFYASLQADSGSASPGIQATTNGSTITDPNSVPTINYPLIRQGNIMSTKHLANIIESRRKRLIYDRDQLTKTARKVRFAAFVAFSISAFFVFLNLNVPFVPYRYGSYVYVMLRVVLIGSLILIVRKSFAISKFITPEEERLNIVATCMISALEKGYDSKLKSVKNKYAEANLFGQVQVPNHDLTAKFLYELNTQIEKKTGEPSPYVVYRFRLEKLWDKAFFIAFKNGLDAYASPYADHVSMEELKRLAS